MTRRKHLADRVVAEILLEKPTLTLPWKGDGEIPLWRLDDEEYGLLHQQSLAIQEDYSFLVRLNWNRNAGKLLTLGRARAAFYFCNVCPRGSPFRHQRPALTARSAIRR